MRFPQTTAVSYVLGLCRQQGGLMKSKVVICVLDMLHEREAQVITGGNNYLVRRFKIIF